MTIQVLQKTIAPMVAHPIKLIIITLIPFLIYYIVEYFFIEWILGLAWSVNPMDVDSAQLAMIPYFGALTFISATLMFSLTVAWIAVGWHRFLLLGPDAFTSVGEVLRAWIGYFFKATLLGVLMALVLLPVGLVTQYLLMSWVRNSNSGDYIPHVLTLLALVAGTLLVMVILRLGGALVGTSLRSPIRFRDAWRLTKPFGLGALLLAFMLVLIKVLSNQIPMDFLSGHQAVTMGVYFGIDWLTTVLVVAGSAALYQLAISNHLEET